MAPQEKRSSPPGCRPRRPESRNHIRARPRTPRVSWRPALSGVDHLPCFSSRFVTRSYPLVASQLTEGVTAPGPFHRPGWGFLLRGPQKQPDPEGGPYDRDTGTFSSGALIRTVAGNGVDREEKVFSGSVNPIRAFHQPYGLDIDPREGALYFFRRSSASGATGGPELGTREAPVGNGTAPWAMATMRAMLGCARPHLSVWMPLPTSTRRTPRTSASAAFILSPTDPDSTSCVRVSWLL